MCDPWSNVYFLPSYTRHTSFSLIAVNVFGVRSSRKIELKQSPTSSINTIEANGSGTQRKKKKNNIESGKMRRRKINDQMTKDYVGFSHPVSLYIYAPANRLSFNKISLVSVRCLYARFSCPENNTLNRSLFSINFLGDCWHPVIYNNKVFLMCLNQKNNGLSFLWPCDVHSKCSLFILFFSSSCFFRNRFSGSIRK